MSRERLLRWEPWGNLGQPIITIICLSSPQIILGSLPGSSGYGCGLGIGEISQALALIGTKGFSDIDRGEYSRSIKCLGKE